jgi:hypothetical protein
LAQRTVSSSLTIRSISGILSTAQGCWSKRSEILSLCSTGLAASLLFDGIYDFDEVKMTIFQPRRDNISSFTLPKEELYLWAEETVKPIATLAFEGKGDFAQPEAGVSSAR